MKTQMLFIAIFLIQLNQFAFSSSIDSFSIKSRQELSDFSKSYFLQRRNKLIRDLSLAETPQEKTKILREIQELDAEIERRKKLSGSYIRRDPVTGKSVLAGYDASAEANIGSSRPHPLNLSKDYKRVNPNLLDPTARSLAEMDELNENAQKEYAKEPKALSLIIIMSIITILIISLSKVNFTKKTEPLKEEISQNKISSREAMDRLKLAKEKLDLQLITQQEYDVIKEKLAEYIT
jgi:hypothetical protein